ncbi:hypothetical protein CFAM422_007851 [Trichoderma lentiforme]|uniref:Uncharacterized protein n=1 Tax=Trichoderma lentiforme TaxID=1567552 RepID=A0A9P4XDN6_9HYPO|nr:hypothetical protein CFAM422_007851 [Trichoderma lentiforme]
MAPGYRSPFDHPPSPKPIHNADIMPLALAIFLCISIIVCLILFVFCTATRHNQNKHLLHRDDASAPAQEMVLDQSFFPKNLAVPPGEDPQRAVNIRDEHRIDDLQQPLLPAGTYNNSPANDAEMATRRHDNVYKGSIHWHGINILNTSWGWMA